MGVFLAIVAFAILIALLTFVRWGIPWLCRPRRTEPEKLGLSELQGSARLQSLGGASSLAGKEHNFVFELGDTSDLSLPDPDSGKYDQARAERDRVKALWKEFVEQTDLPSDRVEAAVGDKVGSDPDDPQPLTDQERQQWKAVGEAVRCTEIHDVEIVGHVKDAANAARVADLDEVARAS